jgi:hypothetical protein
MKNRTKTMDGGCLALFGLPFLLAGLGMTGWFYFNAVKWWRVQSWEEVPCTIEAAGLSSSHGKSTTYRATATYRYWFSGHTYESERVALTEVSDNLGSFQRDVYNELKPYLQEPGSMEDQREFRCYVNPSKPSEAILYRSLRWQMQAFLAVFCLTFPAVGAALVVGGLIGSGAKRKKAALRTAYPEEAWNWEPGGTEGILRPSNGGAVRVLFLYTVWAGLIVGCLLVTTYVSGAFSKEPTSWLVLIFLGLWCIPARFALRRWSLRRMVGQVHLAAETLPAVPGRWFRGAVVFGKPLPCAGLATISLKCSKTDSSGESSTTEEVWSHVDSVPMSEGSVQVPISISLPADAPTTNKEENSNHTTAWELSITLPGNSASTEFEIPVYHTAATTMANAAEMPTIVTQATVNLAEAIAKEKIHLSLTDDGLPETIECGRRGALPLTIVALIWTGMTLGLFLQNRSSFFDLLFPLAFLVCSIPILGFALWSWLNRTVQISPHLLRIHYSLGTVQWVKEFTKTDILEFSHDSNSSVNNTPYYRVRLITTAGKKFVLVHGIKGGSRAAALAHLLQQWHAKPVHQHPIGSHPKSS